MELMIIDERKVLDQQFRIYGTVEEPLFLAKDVAEWIGYDKSSINKMLAAIDDDEKLLGTIFRSGQNRETWFLKEDGMYETLMLSRKPVAKQFKKEVKRILKEIRLSKGYVTQGGEAEFVEKAFRYLSPETKALLVKELCARNDALTQEVHTLGDKVQCLDMEVKLLSDEALKWADRSFIVALMRRYSFHAYYGSAQNRLRRGWDEFYQRLEYSDAKIALKKRRHERAAKPDKMSLLNFLADSEITFAVKISAAMCIEKGLDISDHVAKLREPDTAGLSTGTPEFANGKGAQPAWA